MSIPYSKKSLNQLMQELENLGGSSQIKMQQNYFIGILNNQSQGIRMYESQDNRQFIVLKNKKKKYYYNEIVPNLTEEQISQILVSYYNGFNVNLIVSNIDVKKVFNLFPKSDDLAFNHISYGISSHENILDLVGDKIINKYEPQFFNFDSEFQFSQPNQNLTITRIIYPTKTNSELRIIKIPEIFYSENNVCRSQIIQILEFLKKNKDKIGKQIIGKLFIKKHKIISMLIDTVFDNSLNWIINKLEQNQINLEFFNRFKSIRNFTKKSQKVENLKITKIQHKKKKIPKSNNNKHMQSTSIQQRSSNMQNNQNVFIEGQSKQNYTYQTEQELQKTQFNFCRTLERKTHKYSISPNRAEILQELEYQPKKYNKALSQEQQLSILKSNHIIQISKYHQTIQALNAKLLILAKDKGIQEICSVYQKEIMNLQFKIEELRKNISQISQGDQKSLKNVIKKLNDQIRMMESAKRQEKQKQKYLQTNKFSQKEMKQCNEKLKKSQSARSFLAEQLKQLSKRLQIRQVQIIDLNKKIQKLQQLDDLFQKETLSVKSQKQYTDLNTLLNQISQGNGVVLPYIRQKVSNLFINLSDSKKLIIECHNFLLQLQNMLQKRLSNLDQILVLDCNRFIRGFLLKSMQVIE